MDFSDTNKSPFMDGLDHSYAYDPYLQDTSSPVLMGFNSPYIPDLHHSSLKSALDTGLPSPPLEMNALQLAYPDGPYPGFASNSILAHIPQRPITPPDGMGIAPLSSYQLAPAVAPDMSPSQSSQDSITQSPLPATPPELRAGSSRRSNRYNPMIPPSGRGEARAQRKKRLSEDSDDEDDEFRPCTDNISGGTGEDRKELVRRQRIESEQKRRDDLRDGYSRLKGILPASNMKSSKVVLLERATNQIRFLDGLKDQLETRLGETEAEMRRLRRVNDVLMEQRAMQPAATMPGF